MQENTIFQSSGDLLADRRFEMARRLRARGDCGAAIELLEQTLERVPRFAAGWFALGDWREAMSDRDGAIDAFCRARDADPRDRHGAGLRLRLLGGGDDAMPADYVRAVFDQYAPAFDQALAALSYCAPAMLAGAIAELCRADRCAMAFGAMLDLGCGTGLAGAALRDVVRRLEGFDLSSAMIEQARRKGIYDACEVEDLTAALAQRARDAKTYDLIVAADVFVYCAALGTTMKGCAEVLSPRGLLAFTVETHAGDGVQLGRHLRYAHGEAHVREALAQSLLIVRHLSRVSTRTEAGAPVPGLLVVAQSP